MENSIIVENADKANANIESVSNQPPAKYTSAHVANYILKTFFKENIEITPIKLQKLLYICYGWNLAFSNKKLFDEPIQAWKWGPVVPSIYYYYRKMKEVPNNYYVGVFDEEKFDYSSLEMVPIIPEDDEETTDVLKLVLSNYKNKSAFDLVSITHEKESPWDKVYNKDNIPESGKNLPLNDSDIKNRSMKKILDLYPIAQQ